MSGATTRRQALKRIVGLRGPVTGFPGSCAERVCENAKAMTACVCGSPVTSCSLSFP